MQRGLKPPTWQKVIVPGGAGWHRRPHFSGRPGKFNFPKSGGRCYAGPRSPSSKEATAMHCGETHDKRNWDRHEYSMKVCPKCGKGFCYSCCAGQNVDQGGKYDPDYMYCPSCGNNYYG